MNLYDILYSLQKFLTEQTGVRTDIIYDGYVYPKVKPFMTIETLMDERIYRAKRREAVQSIEHIQLSYHAEHFADRTRMADEISDLLTFNKIPFYKADGSDSPIGFFDVKVTAVTPMPADELARESEKHRVHFDLEIERIKRRG